MTPIFLDKCIQEGMSIRQIALKANKSATTVRYWLKKYGLKTKRKKQVVDIKHCPSCKKEKPLAEFYKRRGKVGGSVYCKPCTLEQTLKRQRSLKQKAIEYKGGKCENCGYDKCNAALEFHHKNPETKEFSLSKLKNYKFSKAVEEELDKCSLLCANCHREIHDLWARGEREITGAF